jgi:hypothetical protein
VRPIVQPDRSTFSEQTWTGSAERRSATPWVRTGRWSDSAINGRVPTYVRLDTNSLSYLIDRETAAAGVQCIDLIHRRLSWDRYRSRESRRPMRQSLTVSEIWPRRADKLARLSS